jgi:hypothetical protein
VGEKEKRKNKKLCVDETRGISVRRRTGEREGMIK